MIHIGFITSHYPFDDAPSVGGIGTSIKNLALEIVSSGHKATVFVYDQPNEGKRVENGISIYTIARPSRKSPFSWWTNRKTIEKKINLACKSDNIDILEAPDWTGITAFIRLKAPLVIRLHGSDAYFCKLEGRTQKKKNFLFEKWALSNADALVSPSDFTAKLTAEIFKLDQSRIATIPNGISVNDFKNEKPFEFDRGTLLYVGAIIRKKGVLELPKIMSVVLRSNPDAKLVLIGSDSRDVRMNRPSTWELMREEMDDTVRDKIKYLGKIPYAEIGTYLKKAHLCVFPTFAETFGMVTIEAMAMKKAVVSSNFGWAAEIVQNGDNGFLADPSNAEAFASKITELLQDDELCRNMAENARKRVESAYDIVGIAQKNIAFYNNLLSKNVGKS